MLGFALVYAWLLVVCTVQAEEELPQWPQHLSVLKVRGIARHVSPSLLIVLNMYSFIHWEVIDEHFSAYRDICEGGWSIKIIILTAADWSERLLKWSHRNLYCYRDTNGIGLEIRRFNQSVGKA